MRNNFVDLENIIYSKIKYGLSNELKSQFPDIEISTSNINESDTAFPYIYVHLLPCAEIVSDLEQSTITDMSATFQIEVTDNQKQKNTSIVIQEIVEIMKKMNFNATQMPYNDNTRLYRSICRFRRTISYNDVI